MTALLAKGFADSLQIDALFETVTGLFSRLDFLAYPENVLPLLEQLTVTWSVIFIIAGAMCLANGYRLYKWVTVGLALLIGLFSGYALGGAIGVPYILGGCIGLLLAVICMPLMKYAVALLGGLIGAFIGANLWTGIADALARAEVVNLPPDLYWAGALIGLIVAGMLAFILFKLAVVMMATVSGSTLVVLGTIALLLTFEPIREPVVNALTANQVVIPLLVFVPAVIAAVWQETQKDQPPDPEPKPAKA
ncbi:MAG: hypothetical protein AAGB29_11110 [Planctomycetota bacterium]